ncbi:MAG TPA: signal peptidase I [Micromonosporaceae bacterium]
MDELVPWAGGIRGGHRPMPLWQELPLLLVVAFCIAVLVRTFLLQMFFIPSGSMEDTLREGDRVLVNKVVYQVREPARGEIVVFHGTAAWNPLVTEPDPGFVGKVGRTLADLVGISRPGEKDFIKRVIGLPGDRVMCCDDRGRVMVNGVPLDESYVVRNSPEDAPPDSRHCRSRRFNEIVVPPGHLFVMGDHRLRSEDSRCQGTVPIDNVIGRAFVVVWPADRWASLPAPATFDEVPQPSAALPGAGVPATADPLGGMAMLLPLLSAFRVSGGSPPRRRNPRPVGSCP